MADERNNLPELTLTPNPEAAAQAMPELTLDPAAARSPGARQARGSAGEHG